MSSTLEPKQAESFIASDSYAAVRPRTSLVTIIPWIMCGIGALFYIYEYLL